MIDMTPDELKSILHYDPETGLLTRKTASNKYGIGHVPGWRHDNGYIKISIKKKMDYAHRIAWAIHFGKWPEKKIDHINRDRGDNRIVNLRLADDSQNAANQSLRSDNTSGKKGVTWNKIKRKWQAQIQFRGKRKAGYFDSIDDAAKFYDDQAKIMCSEYFILNGDS